MRIRSLTSSLRLMAVVGLAALIAAPTTAVAFPLGTSAPAKVLTGSETSLSGPQGIAFDAACRMYVASPYGGPQGMGHITVYASNWASGKTKPIKMLSGDATRLANPFEIAFDTAGRMYVANQVGPVTVYAPNWASGDTAPIKVLGLGDFDYGITLDIAIDPGGRLVASFTDSQSRVDVFAANWVTASPEIAVRPDPIRSLYDTGPADQAWYASAIAFDAAGRMYLAQTISSLAADPGRLDGAANASRQGIAVYPATWTAPDTAPVAVIDGPSTQLPQDAAILGLAIDFLGRVYVSNYVTGVLNVYPASWANPDTAPLYVLSGSSTDLTTPLDLEFDARGNLYVSNWDNLGGRSTVNLYPPDKSVTLTATRPRPTTIVIAGKTTGIVTGSTVTPYVKVAARGQTFKALAPVKLTGQGLARGSFRLQLTGLQAKKAYQVYVVVDGVRSATVTVSR